MLIFTRAQTRAPVAPVIRKPSGYSRDIIATASRSRST
jgi:hypothetical protein